MRHDAHVINAIYAGRDFELCFIDTRLQRGRTAPAAITADKVSRLRFFARRYDIMAFEVRYGRCCADAYSARALIG